MNRISVQKYCPQFYDAWNEFIGTSKNGTFLHDRRYMEYHADRFDDFSLLFFDEPGRLIAIMPASLHGEIVISHGGLTYGGVISNGEMKTATMLRLFEALIDFLRGAAITKLVYKAIPHVFHRIPSEEDLYALFVNNAKLQRRDASSAIWLPDRMKFAKGKREGVKKAQRAGLEVKPSADYEAFFNIGRAVMRDRHKLEPVHTSYEMALLAGRFPENIRLHASSLAGRMLAGVISFIFPSSVHIQYMYNSDEGLPVGALDIVVDYLVNHCYRNYNYLSFGVSTEDNGRFLNGGLIHQKEMFGARSIVHDFYEVDL